MEPAKNRFVRNAMDKNKEEKIRYAIEELVEKGNLGIVDETFATDYVAHAGEKEYNRRPALAIVGRTENPAAKYPCENITIRADRKRRNLGIL
jgi:hypothetical protein